MITKSSFHKNNSNKVKKIKVEIKYKARNI